MIISLLIVKHLNHIRVLVSWFSLCTHAREQTLSMFLHWYGSFTESITASPHTDLNSFNQRSLDVDFVADISTVSSEDYHLNVNTLTTAKLTKIFWRYILHTTNISPAQAKISEVSQREILVVATDISIKSFVLADAGDD